MCVFAREERIKCIRFMSVNSMSMFALGKISHNVVYLSH